MNIKCILGHYYHIVGGGHLCSVVDASIKGEYRLLRCVRCGKMKQEKFI